MACVSLQIAPVTVSSWSVYQARFAAHWALVLITKQEKSQITFSENMIIIVCLYELDNQQEDMGMLTKGSTAKCI